MADFNNDQTKDSGAIPVRPVAGTTSNPATPKSGQRKLTASGTATAISATSVPLSNGVIVKALDTNSGKLAVGPAGVTTATDGTGNGYVIAPGEAVSFGVNDAANIFFNGTTATDGVCWAAS